MYLSILRIPWMPGRSLSVRSRVWTVPWPRRRAWGLGCPRGGGADWGLGLEAWRLRPAGARCFISRRGAVPGSLAGGSGPLAGGSGPLASVVWPTAQWRAAPPGGCTVVSLPSWLRLPPSVGGGLCRGHHCRKCAHPKSGVGHSWVNYVDVLYQGLRWWFEMKAGPFTFDYKIPGGRKIFLKKLLFGNGFKLTEKWWE